uniref:guanylate cyclase soluble subunit alpha-1-like isoform X1 n=1 Tax=Styela clava TaxID=7725 RepID=UPI00193ADC5E|nr:guanylate cyclase soluble subunit alpha-1-like isoform X1 [Styela clava]
MEILEHSVHSRQHSKEWEKKDVNGIGRNHTKEDFVKEKRSECPYLKKSSKDSKNIASDMAMLSVNVLSGTESEESSPRGTRKSKRDSNKNKVESEIMNIIGIKAMTQDRRGSCPGSLTAQKTWSPASHRKTPRSERKYKNIGCPFMAMRQNAVSTESVDSLRGPDSPVFPPVSQLAFEGFLSMKGSIENVSFPTPKRSSSFRRRRVNTISDTPPNRSPVKSADKAKKRNRKVRRLHRKYPTIGASVFCNAFPFHIIFNRRMNLVQTGVGVLKLMSPRSIAAIKATKIQKQDTDIENHSEGPSFEDYFRITSPESSESCLLAKTTSPSSLFSWILDNQDVQFILELKRTEAKATCESTIGEVGIQGMEIRGQMMYIQEDDCVLFFGSPHLRKLDELTGTGIYISDIPIHDATRDVILVGEQAKAQEGLKRRMDKLRSTCEENNHALEKERRLNTELLYSIFPADVAEDLWMGKQIKARKIKDVTMLFSDIVGFTSICSTCTPMQVISMLSDLYTKFDEQCGVYDVYKVETIGDAYCVAGGLHRQTETHAHQISWMALFMIKCCDTAKTPKGDPIKMRIGLHSGPIVTGVVGTRMPRYCMFGNNVTLANKFESHSEENRINVSPTTYELLKDDPGFKFTARPRGALPADFPNDMQGTCYFLDSYEPPFGLGAVTSDNVNNTAAKFETEDKDGLLETLL